MLKFLVQYSGIFAAIFAWGFVATPSMLTKFDKKRYPISFTGTFPKIGHIFNFGVVASATMQILLGYWLYISFDQPSILFGLLVFLVATISLFFSGLINFRQNKRLHTFFASTYFLFTTVGGLFISLSLLDNYLQTALWGITFATSGLVFMVYFYWVKKNKVYCEYAGILCSTLWMLSFYLAK